MIPLTTIFNIKLTIISQPIIFIYFCRSVLSSEYILEASDADLACFIMWRWCKMQIHVLNSACLGGWYTFATTNAALSETAVTKKKVMT